MTQDWITAEQAGEILGVSALEVARKIRKGIIPAERFGRSYKIKRADVEKYLENPIPPGNPKISEMKIWELSPKDGNPELYKKSPNWAKSQRRKRRTKKEKS